MSQNYRVIQSSLVSGIISEEAIGRLDYPKYYNGCAEATNMIVQPTGGMNKRAGFQYLADLDKEYRMIEFIFNTYDKYVVLLGDNEIKIWDIMNPSATSFVGITNEAQLYDANQVRELDFVQSGDTMIFTHGNVQPQKLVRYRTESGLVTWKLEVIELKNIPQFNWDENKHDAGASRVKKANSGDNDILQLRDDILEAITVGEGMNSRFPSTTIEKFQTRPAGSYYTVYNTTTTTRAEFWYPSGILASETNTAGDTETRWATQIVTSGSDGSYSSSIAWDEPIDELVKKAIRNRLSLKDTDYSSLTSEQLNTLIGDDYTDEIRNIINEVLGTWDQPEEYIEDVWGIDSRGVNHGYPRYCAFYQNRLFFAGSPAKPMSVWGSVLNDFFNFDISESDPDYAIADTINSNVLNQITGIYAGKYLQVYTTGAEFVNQSLPITPTDSSWNFETGMGSKANVPLDSLDGSTIYIDRSGAVRNFVYNYDTDRYLSKNLALLAKQAVISPTKLVIIRSSTVDLSKLMYFLNKDGTLAVLNYDINEEILAWTKIETDGIITDIVGVDQSLFLIVKRNGIYSFECLNRREYTYNTDYNPDNDVFLDKFIEVNGIEADEACADSIGGVLGDEWNLDGIWGTTCHMFVDTTSLVDTTITGLDMFEGTYVTVMLDGYYQGEFLVTGGEITVNRTFITGQIGYLYSGIIKTLPLSSQQYGSQINYNRIVKITGVFNKSTAVTIDGQFISDRNFDSYVFGEKPQALSGLKEVYTLGWDRFAQYEIRSDYPYKMNLLSFTTFLDSNSAV